MPKTIKQCNGIMKLWRNCFLLKFPADVILDISTEEERWQATTADPQFITVVNHSQDQMGQLKDWEEAGYGHLPVCMAKTQYSFTTDPNRRGAPLGHSVPVREVRLSAGAGFIVVICGEIMTMPGLPSVPASEAIMLNDLGQIEGLF